MLPIPFENSSSRVAVGDGCYKGIDRSGTGGLEGGGAFVQGCAAGGDIVDQADRFAGKGMGVSDGEGVFDVGASLRFGQVPLAAGVASANQIGADASRRAAQAAGQHLGLVVAAFKAPAPVQRDGNKIIDPGRQAADSQRIGHHPAQASGILGTLVKLERQNQIAQGGFIHARPHDALKGEGLVLTGAAAIVDNGEGAGVTAAMAAVIAANAARQLLPAGCAQAVVVAADGNLAQHTDRWKQQMIQPTEAISRRIPQTRQ